MLYNIDKCNEGVKMAKLNKIIIIDSHTLKLDQDAKRGDEINLLDLETIDTSILSQKIDQAKDQEYNKRLQALENRLQLEKERDIEKATKESQSEIIRLQEKISNQENQVKAKISSEYDLKIEKYKYQIQDLEKEKSQILNQLKKDIELAEQKKINEIKDDINDYKNHIQDLIKENNHIKTQAALKQELAVKEKENLLNNTIQEKEAVIARLSKEKMSLNIKKMGEELEIWVDQEYQNHALQGFESCQWYKDNESIKEYGDSKGTKADFIFKVFSDQEYIEEKLLTSVAIEIKTEDQTSTYKKKNADHYDKLDKDRQKKNCEYALLISELEWDSINDAPIRKVQGYDKMYMVRPQYFIVFLSIVSALGKKYHELILNKHIERKKFKETEEILNELELMKDDILDKSITYLQNKMDEIRKSAENIEKEAKNILEASRIVIDSHVRTIINKINNFKLYNIIEKIESLQD